jgi:hypothetical protein
MLELEMEAKERRDDEYGAYPLIRATDWEGMEAVVVRIQRAWPGSVDALSNDGVNAIMEAAFIGKADHVNTLATMGTDSLTRLTRVTMYSELLHSPSSLLRRELPSSKF